MPLRVANGVKWGRGREEAEAPERRKRCLSVARSLESVGGGGCGQAPHGELPSVPAPLEAASAEPSAREPPSTPGTAWRARSARGRGAAEEQPCWAGGLPGWGAETARTRSAFRSKEPYFWEGTGNCQSAREGAHRRRVMSADQLLANKEGLLLEKVAAAKATAAPRSLGGEGQVGEGRRDGCGSGSGS